MWTLPFLPNPILEKRSLNRSTRTSSCSMSSMARTNTMNSSPPNLPHMSPEKCSLISSASFSMTSSPTRCPKLSFTSLNPSMSIMIMASVTPLLRSSRYADTSCENASLLSRPVARSHLLLYSNSLRCSSSSCRVLMLSWFSRLNSLSSRSHSCCTPMKCRHALVTPSSLPYFCW